MTQKSELGQYGEGIACDYLRNKRYKILLRNYRKTWGELDIVALDRHKTLVIIEVKTVSGENPRITGEMQMTNAKLKKLRRTAELFANEYMKGNPIKRLFPIFRREETDWRIDLIVVNVFAGKHVPQTEKPASPAGRHSVKHYENI